MNPKSQIRRGAVISVNYANLTKDQLKKWDSAPSGLREKPPGSRRGAPSPLPCHPAHTHTHPKTYFRLSISLSKSPSFI